MRKRIDLEGILRLLKDNLNMQCVLEKSSNTQMLWKRLRIDSWVEDSQLLGDIGIYGNWLENEMQRCLVKVNISPHHRRASRGLITLNLHKKILSLYALLKEKSHNFHEVFTRIYDREIAKKLFYRRIRY